MFDCVSATFSVGKRRLPLLLDCRRMGGGAGAVVALSSVEVGRRRLFLTKSHHGIVNA